MTLALRLFATLLLAFGFAGKSHAALSTQFSIDMTAATGTAGSAAVGFDGTHLWVAKWASADIVILLPNGTLVETFQVPGLTGTRSLSWDGSHFWVANNSTTVNRVDPVTRTITSSITVPLSTRYASFDPTANSGAGGLWIGNFNTDIVLVSLTGTTLTTLPASGFPAFTGRYSVVFDNTTGSAPFLWAFFQAGTAQTELGIIDLPSGTARSGTQNLAAGLASTGTLAGGASLTTGLVSGQPTLLTMVQGVPDILLGLQPSESVPVELQSFSVD
jgi:hypothetical protein